jgi:hypothetical protein
MPSRQARLEGPKDNHSFRDFEGINTQASRQAIRETQFAWIEDVMPIGPGNLKVTPAANAALATLPTGNAYYATGYNLNAVAYMFVATSDGAAYQVRESDGAITTIAAAATFSGTSTQASQWRNDRILIIDTNANTYRDWNGTVLTNNSGVTSAPASGTLIATAFNRVWIFNQRTVTFSAPNSYTDFTGASAGGSVIISDETLDKNINAAIPANNFLYFLGNHSVNVISDVRVVSGTTIFSNTNISASIGTTFSQSVWPYYRSIFFANQSGIYSQYGSTPVKASDDLDGIFQALVTNSSIVGGSVMLNNILCLAFLINYQDPVAGARKIFAVFANKKWFVSTQRTDLNTLAVANVGGVDRLYGFSNTGVYRLFADTTSLRSWYFKTALWDEEEPLKDKQVLKVGVEVSIPQDLDVSTMTVTLDTELSSQSLALGQKTVIIWLNNLGATITWFNNSFATIPFITTGVALLKSDISNVGKYVGLTVSGNSPQLVLLATHIEFEKRARW